LPPPEKLITTFCQSLDLVADEQIYETEELSVSNEYNGVFGTWILLFIYFLDDAVFKNRDSSA
jgi:hypothetical protein